MPCVKVKFGDGSTAILNMAPPVRRIVSGGKEFFFEFHEYLGPSIVNKKTGNPTGTFPRKNSPFWDAVWNWLRQGKQVDAEGNCIFKHEMKLVDIVMDLGDGRNFYVLNPQHPRPAPRLEDVLAEKKKQKDKPAERIRFMQVGTKRMPR